MIFWGKTVTIDFRHYFPSLGNWLTIKGVKLNQFIKYLKHSFKIVTYLHKLHTLYYIFPNIFFQKNCYQNKRRDPFEHKMNHHTHFHKLCFFLNYQLNEEINNWEEYIIKCNHKLGIFTLNTHEILDCSTCEIHWCEMGSHWCEMGGWRYSPLRLSRQDRSFGLLNALWTTKRGIIVYLHIFIYKPLFKYDLKMGGGLIWKQ